MKKERNYGIEYLRILAMVLIVLNHLNTYGQILYTTKNLSPQYVTVWGLHLLDMVGVNAFAMISGYVGAKAGFKLSRLFNLYFKVLFYSVGFFAIFALINRENVMKATILQSFLPISTGTYWYISCYVGLFFLMPLLNLVIEKASRKVLFGSIAGTLFFLSGLSVVLQIDAYGVNHGFSVLWLALMYLIGGYLQKHQVAARYTKRKAGLFAFLCFLAAWLGKMAIDFVSTKFFGEIKFIYVLCNNDTIFIVLEAIFLVILFSKIEVKNKGLQKVTGLISAATLGVYLIHMNVFVKTQLLQDATISYAAASPGKILGVMFLMTICIYLGCTIVDIIRAGLFKLCRIDRLAAFLGDFFTNCYNKMFEKKLEK